MQKAKNTATIAAIILIFVSLRDAGAENMKEEVQTEVVKNVRSVTLGIFYVRDSEFDRVRSLERDNISSHEYLRLLTEMAEKAHLGNVTSANISLVFMGTEELNISYAVETITHGSMDASTTLENFRNYSLMHWQEYGRPDLTVLVTGNAIRNSSECQATAKSSNTKISTTLLRRYCESGYGESYFKGMCGNNSVAILRELGRNFYGAPELARQILRLMAVSSDDLRKEPECNNPEGYVTSSGWWYSVKPKHPGLSSCGEAELIKYIDSMSNSSNKCWEDVPNATIPQSNLTLDNLFDSVDMCKWAGRINNGNCSITNRAENPDAACKMPCCERGEVEPYYTVYYPGKPCGENGVCFERKCYPKTLGVA